MTVKIDRDTGVMVAVLVGKHRCLDDAAKRLKSAAIAKSAPFKDTGEFQRGFKIKKIRGRPGKSGQGVRVTDRLVYNDSRQVARIELGHKTRAGKKVPGKKVLITAARELAAGS